RLADQSRGRADLVLRDEPLEAVLQARRGLELADLAHLCQQLVVLGRLHRVLVLKLGDHHLDEVLRLQIEVLLDGGGAAAARARRRSARARCTQGCARHAVGFGAAKGEGSIIGRGKMATREGCAVRRAKTARKVNGWRALWA